MNLPRDRKRVAFWACCLVALVAAPLISPGGQWVSLLCRVGVLSVFALSYNLLLGETGLLSFGHAVYFGLGAFSTVHVLRAIHDRAWGVPVDAEATAQLTALHLTPPPTDPTTIRE